MGLRVIEKVSWHDALLCLIFESQREQIIVRAPDAATFRGQLQSALAALEPKREGFDIVLDALGGMYFKESFNLLARGGRMVTFGAATFMSPKVRTYITVCCTRSKGLGGDGHTRVIVSRPHLKDR